MENIFRFSIAYLIAPALVAVVAWAFAAALGVTLTAVVVALGLLGVALLLRALSRPVRRWYNNHFSPVRRRHPRPAAWHQWR